MIILGIDPGTTRLGYGVLKKSPPDLKLINYGCFRFDDIDATRRPREVFKAIQKLIAEEKPDIVAIEQVFFSKNKKTAMAVSEARGAVLAAVSNDGIKVKSYSPSEVKKATGVAGPVGKKGVQKMVRLLLGLKEDPQPDDAADALAIAICCASNQSASRDYPQ